MRKNSKLIQQDLLEIYDEREQIDLGFKNIENK